MELKKSSLACQEKNGTDIIGTKKMELLIE